MRWCSDVFTEANLKVSLDHKHFSADPFLLYEVSGLAEDLVVSVVGHAMENFRRKSRKGSGFGFVWQHCIT